jgi:adenylate cyclase
MTSTCDTVDPGGAAALSRRHPPVVTAAGRGAEPPSAPPVPAQPPAAPSLRRRFGLRTATAWLERFLLGAEAPGEVPARARQAILRSDAETEVLVGWVQAAAIVTFAVLYTISPKAFPPGVPFEPVPWALGFYAVFTAVRLWLAYARRLTGAILGLSVVVDFTVLMLTIWSFHLQYQQPAGLYVKAPTLMYAFILIALRALRFEARWVLLAGGCAIGGWLALVLYAVYLDPMGLAVTRNYAEYMTSYRILLGAEFDKMVSLGMVTAILAVVVLRARRLLVLATAERIAGDELSRFFAPEVAEAIRHAEMPIAPGQGMLREAAILFVDLRGFTKLSATMVPSDVMQLLGDYQARLVPLIRRHGGRVDKYLGDGILASFGAVTTSTTFAADALRAVDALLDAADAWARERVAAGQEPLRIGCGVAAGAVISGAVGDAERLEFTVIGDTVNLAAKLQSHCKAEKAQALTTAAMLALAERQGYRPPRPPEPRPGHPVPGVEAPVDLVVLG